MVPLYYQVNDDGIPVDWVKKMKESMKTIGPAFSARRMVKEYSQKFYQPALKAAERSLKPVAQASGLWYQATGETPVPPKKRGDPAGRP